MKRHLTTIAAVAALLTLMALPSAAALVDLAVGAYGGINTSMEDEGSTGSILGAKVRVLPPVPMIGVEAWYAKFGYEEPENVLEEGDLSLVLDGDGFTLWGIDALIGAVGGGPGMKWYGVVGVNATEFEEFGKDEKTRKLGGEVGVAMEMSPPAIGLGVELRGTVMFPDISGDFEEKLFTATVGVNYYF